MRFSFSRVECFKNCPYHFKLRYIDKLETLPDYDDPANPLIIGTALHHGIEKGVKEAIKEYFNSFPVISDGHINEAMKLRALIPKVRELISDSGEFEVTLSEEGFIGYIDYLDREKSILLDFKYTTEKNLKEKYLKSPQIHVYRDYLKKLTGYEVQRIGYLFVPKISIRQKKTETLRTFRERLEEELNNAQPRIEYVEYSQKKSDEFQELMKEIEKTQEFPKNQTRLCDWCDYQDYCRKGEDYMINLPENKRRAINGVSHKKIWIYGSPFSGKTTFADNFEDPLMINTDGNINFVTSPFVEIKDIVEVEGKLVKTTLAWEVFKNTVAELEKGSSFKTIVVDLVEDLYESCRLYMYKQMGITHESDDSYRAWDKIRTEFLSTMRKLTNLNYNVILISHEDMSKDITKRSGDKITSIRPNINEKVANKLSGMVDIVARLTVVEGDYRISFKSDEVVFGGGRINPENKEISNNYETFLKVVYNEIAPVQGELPIFEETPNELFKPQAKFYEEEPVEDTPVVPEVVAPAVEEPASAEPVKRVRRTRKTN
jgi:phage nucleotide-binding protein